MIRVRIKVYGDVQGVFFRHFTKKKALKLELNGWCRNESDGSVLIVAEGDNEKVKEFIAWCHKGSPMASVQKIDVIEEEYKGVEGRFEVR